MIDSKAFKAARIQKGLTQKELADGVASQTVVSYIEKSGFEPSRTILEAFAERLGINAKDVLIDGPKGNVVDDLKKADALYKNYQHLDVLNLLKPYTVSNQENVDTKLHLLYLRTMSKMWNSNNYDDAIFGLNQIIQNSESRPSIYDVLAFAELGVIYQKKGDLDKASYFFENTPERLAKLDPELLKENPTWYVLILDNLAQYFNKQQEPDQSDVFAHQIIDFNIKNQSSFDLEEAYYLVSDNEVERNGWNDLAKKYLILSWSMAVHEDNEVLIKYATQRLLEHKILSKTVLDV